MSEEKEEEEEEEKEQERDPELPVVDAELKQGEEDEGEEWEPNRQQHSQDWEVIMGNQERLAYDDLRSESDATADGHSPRHLTLCEPGSPMCGGGGGGTCEGVRG